MIKIIIITNNSNNNTEDKWLCHIPRCFDDSVVTMLLTAFSVKMMYKSNFLRLKKGLGHRFTFILVEFLFSFIN